MKENEHVNVLILSPHRDDAAFSCGLLLATFAAARVQVQIANVCTISDYAPYADTSGMTDRIAGISGLRAEEDAAFLRYLRRYSGDDDENVRLLDLGWHDAPLRHAMATEDVLAGGVLSADEVARLAGVFDALSPASVVLVPMAMGMHLDHRLVRQAALETWPGTKLVFYEDLPYACRMPSMERDQQMRLALPWPCRQAKATQGSGGIKRGVALCYDSQIAPSVAEEMEDYGAALGWRERFYGSDAALRILDAVTVRKEIAG